MPVTPNKSSLVCVPVYDYGADFHNLQFDPLMIGARKILINTVLHFRFLSLLNDWVRWLLKINQIERNMTSIYINQICS